MTLEQQRIAIAETCGWVKEVGVTGIQRWRNNRGELCEHTPDYLNDLNAMHEAEKHAIIGPIVRGGKSLLVPYCDMLEVLAEDKESAMVATASQRAEAFLKTLNLWKP